MKWARIAFSILTLVAGYLAWRAAQDRERADNWRRTAALVAARNDSVLRQADSLLQRQGDLALALSLNEAEREYYRGKSARLDRTIARMKAADSLRPTPPDTCGPWIRSLSALGDTLTAFGASEGKRADLAEIAAQRADSGRREALASVGTLSGRLRLADSLLKNHPRLTPAFLSLILSAQVSSSGRLEAVAALRRGNVFAGVSWSTSPAIVAGYRADLRIF